MHQQATQNEDQIPDSPDSEMQPPIKRKRGRPVGSKSRFVKDRPVSEPKKRGRKKGWRKQKVDAPALPSEPPKKAGRPKGSVVKLMNDLSELTREDFSFLRAVTNGIKSHDAYLQFYMDVEYSDTGNPLVPHGHDLNAQVAILVGKMISVAEDSASSEIRRAAKALEKPVSSVDLDAKTQESFHASFDEWYDTQPDGFYSENELPEAYKRYLEEHKGGATQAESSILEQSADIHQKLAAINLLQNSFARLPKAHDSISFWFAPTIAEPLASLGIRTLISLIKLISIHGPKWHKIVREQARQDSAAKKLNEAEQSKKRKPKGQHTPKGPSPFQAIRIEAWLESHSETCGAIDKSSAAWTPAQPYGQSKFRRSDKPELLVIDQETGIATPEHRFGLAPIELITVPAHLDGSNGLFKSSAPNQLGAKNDLEAIQRWLNGFLVAEKKATFEAYRKEVERFYLWCIEISQTALSSVSLSHAQSYQVFLKSIPPDWITQKRVPRSDPRWRPFRGQINIKSQNYALSVLKHLFSALHINGYLTSNPFVSLLSSSDVGQDRVMDTTRTFHKKDLELIKRALETLPGLDSKSNQVAAIARRSKLIMHLGITSGMRVSEISNATLDTLRHPIIDGVPSPDFIIDVIGKRKRKREVLISRKVYELIVEHHKDWEALAPNAKKKLHEFNKSKPLVAALEQPVPKTKPTNTTPRQPKGTGPRNQNRLINDESSMGKENSALTSNGIYRTMKSFFKHVQKICDNDIQRAHLANASPHWMRHTFAHLALETDHSDTGLTVTQQLLGHRSINTTAGYTNQDISTKMKVAQLINPFD